MDMTTGWPVSWACLEECLPGELLQQPGRYRLSFRMRSRSEPIYFMQFCLATEDMQRSMNENMIDIHPLSVEFEVRQ